MLKKILRFFIFLIGASIGYTLGAYVLGTNIISDLFPNLVISSLTALILTLIIALLFGLIFYLSSSWILKKALAIAERTEKELTNIPLNHMISGSIGLILGLLIAFLVNPLLRNIIGQNPVHTVVSSLLYTVLGFLGIRLATTYLAEPGRLVNGIMSSLKSSSANTQLLLAEPKVLDTSVIIDGRIADICKTGFIEGEIVIPEFVLKELRHIADSSDNLKRVRGRRGLDILKVIQHEIDLHVTISSEDFEDVGEVDIKLVKLAQKLGGSIVTNDFNLNKVAGIQGVKVLNINELTNAVKSVVLPGEEMVITVIKEGKEHNQGVAYLDDGTMIVVEDGKRLIGNQVNVVVTSVLQTAAGRMIFARAES